MTNQVYRAIDLPPHRLAIADIGLDKAQAPSDGRFYQLGCVAPLDLGGVEIGIKTVNPDDRVAQER